MAQSRQASFTEALTNVLVGLALALSTQMALYPAFGIRLGFLENVKIALSFTFVSLARSYLIRWLFNQSDQLGERS